MKKRIFVLILSLAMLLCGCQRIQAADLMADITPREVAVPAARRCDELTQFAVELFQVCHEEGENTLISPLSVMYALGMTANGAGGETLAQMEQVLGMELQTLNEKLHAYRRDLPQGKKYTLSLANSIWFKEGLEVERSFLQTNADYYGADAYSAPFDKTTVKDINLWVKQNTNGMIPEILDELSDATVMVLINALAFEAEWAKPYTDSAVREAAFTREDGVEQTATGMYSTENRYLEDENATGFIRYYADKQYAFVALLPNEGVSVAEYVAGLDGQALADMLANASEQEVKTMIPKFETEYDLDLTDVLKAMGMTDAFGGEADFSGISQEDLFISSVIHKTKIQVDEKGTKAAAVTGVTLEAGGIFEEPKKVYLDRPFVYLLIDCKTNTPFFLGTMMDVNG